MRKINFGFLLLFAVLACYSLCSCIEEVHAAQLSPAKDIVTRSYDVKDFSAIQAGSAFKIMYEQASDYSVVASSTQDLLDILEVENMGGVLRFKMTKSLRRWNNEIVITVKSPALNKLNISGACKFNADDISLDTDADIDCSGAAKVAVGVFRCLNLDVHQGGASNLDGAFIVQGEAKVGNSGASKMRGRVNADGMVRIDNSGASSLNLDVKAPRLIVKNSGASGCTLNVECTKMELENNGASRVTLSGKADQIDTRNSGASKINYLDFNRD